VPAEEVEVRRENVLVPAPAMRVRPFVQLSIEGALPVEPRTFESSRSIDLRVDPGCRGCRGSKWGGLAPVEDEGAEGVERPDLDEGGGATQRFQTSFSPIAFSLMWRFWRRISGVAGKTLHSALVDRDQRPQKHPRVRRRLAERRQEVADHRAQPARRAARPRDQSRPALAWTVAVQGSITKTAVALHCDLLSLHRNFLHGKQREEA
jgi:hypothetical protein